jgi:uncharacterized protein
VRVVADTAPLVAAANPRDRAHELSSAMVTALGRDLIVPEPVMVEIDHMLRSRVGLRSARAFLSALVRGEHSTAFLTQGLLRRAAEIDAQYAALDLGLVDAAVMAYAERHELPIFTFDFEDFRAARPAKGHWRLVIDEAHYAEATG